MGESKPFLYMKIYEEIKNNIKDNIWPEGSQIPTEHELMEIFCVSRDTIRRAMQKLLQEGYIYKQAGKGTFVKNFKSNYKLTVLESFTEQMISRKLKPSSNILQINYIQPKKSIAEYLELDDGEKIYEVIRVRLANEEPMCYEIAYVSEKICPDLDKKIDEQTSLYQLYEVEYGLKLEYGDISLEAEKCTEEVSKILKIEEGDPILKMKCLVYSPNSKPLYLVEAFYIGNKYVFTTSMPRTI